MKAALAPNFLKEIRQARRVSQKILADALDVTDMTIGRYESGGHDIGLRHLRRLAAALNCRVSDIIGETDFREATLAEEYASVPVYDARAAAGTGALVEDGAPVGHHLFMLDFLRGITAGPIKHLALIRVAGNSMRDTLCDGDDILVDRSINAPKRDGIYVLRAGASDEVQVKRLQWMSSGHLKVISDNPHYQTLSEVDPGEIVVLGRVIWIGRKV